jgi:hypothetical protein
LSAGENTAGALKRISTMNALAHKIRQFDVVLFPHSEKPPPANDNVDSAALSADIADCHAEAGDHYQSAGAKMWWLP